MKYNKSQFHFELKGYGCYEVTYCTNSRGDYHTAIVNSMPLIDAVKHEDEPFESLGYDDEDKILVIVI